MLFSLSREHVVIFKPDEPVSTHATFIYHHQSRQCARHHRGSCAALAWENKSCTRSIGLCVSSLLVYFRSVAESFVQSWSVFNWNVGKKVLNFRCLFLNQENTGANPVNEAFYWPEGPISSWPVCLEPTVLNVHILSSVFSSSTLHLLTYR